MNEAELLALPEAELNERHSAGEIDLAHLVSLKVQRAGATDDPESIRVRSQREHVAPSPPPEQPKIYPWQRVAPDVQERARKLFNEGWSERGIFEQFPGVSGCDLGRLFEIWSEEKIPQEQRDLERKQRREAGEANLRKWQALHDELAFRNSLAGIEGTGAAA